MHKMAPKSKIAPSLVRQVSKDKSERRNRSNNSLDKSGNSSQARKRRITKDEKICQLKSALKISQEKNNRLLTELENLRAGHDEKAKSNSGRTLTEEQKKFREAMRALKKVTVSQELTIKTLKAKAAERRKEIRQRDKKIDKLEAKIDSMNKAQELLVANSGKTELHAKLRELQGDYDEAIRRQNDLEQMLDEKEVQIEAVQKQRQSLMGINNLPGARRSGNNSDSQSVGSGASASVSTATDFDLARLKTDLAKKSQLITKLELDLEMARDELHEVKRRNARNAQRNHHDGNNTFFPSNQLYGGGRKQLDDDDWGSVSEAATDYESEYGDESEYDAW